VKTAKQLAKHYKSFEKLKNATIEELVTLDDIAEITATDINFYFKNEQNRAELDELLNSYVKLDEGVSVSANGFFAGKKVVLTGTLANFSRDEAGEIIESQGGSTTSSVTKLTDIVLVGENPGSKFEKAKALGVRVMFEDEFMSLIN